MRIDRPRNGDRPGESDQPDRRPDRPPEPPDPPEHQVARILKANADQRFVGRANIERTLRLAGGAKTPDRPPAADRLPNADAASVDRRKFVGYSMDPANPRNNGKWKAWQTVGYDVHHRRDEAADDAIEQLRERLPNAEASKPVDTEYGPRYNTKTRLVGPNGRTGTLIAVWQHDNGATAPRMVTNWLEVDNAKENS